MGKYLEWNFAEKGEGFDKILFFAAIRGKFLQNIIPLMYLKALSN
jgi:hypothetical protein